MKYSLAVVIFVVIAGWSVAPGQQPPHGTGLEWDGKELWIGIGELSPDAQKIGLSEPQIRTRVELRLRKAGIVPLSAPGGPGYLSVDLFVRGNAFSLSVSMVRFAVYGTAHASYQKLAKTWEKSGAGSHGQDTELLFSALDKLLDGFLNDFAEANPPKK
jgi:hypothetical protein